MIYNAKVEEIRLWPIVAGWSVDPTTGTHVKIGDNASVGYNTRVGDYVRVGDNSSVGNYTSVGDGSRVGDNVSVGDGSRVGDNVSVGYGARVGDGAQIAKASDAINVGPGGSHNVFALFTRTHVGTGCFWGTRKEFAGWVAAIHGNTEHAKYYEWALRSTAEHFAELDKVKA